MPYSPVWELIQLSGYLFTCLATYLPVWVLVHLSLSALPHTMGVSIIYDSRQLASGSEIHGNKASG